MNYSINTRAIIFGGHARFLSPFYLDLARQSFQRCRRSKRRPANGYLEGFILVAVALEAFINEMCLEKIDRRKEDEKSTRYLESVLFLQRNRDRNVRDKWRLLPRRLWRKKKFDERTRLWKDFNALIELRNMLVHYKSEYQEEGYIPSVLKPVLTRVVPANIRDLRDLGFLPSLAGNRGHWTNVICCQEMGAWALDTGLNMICRFLQFARQDDDMKGDYILFLSRLRLIQ